MNGLFGLFIFLFAAFIIFYPPIWAYGDAEKRGKSGCLVALLVFLLAFPVGLIIWLIIRPEDNSY